MYSQFKRLITIDCEVKLPINSQNLIPQTKNKTKLLELFKELEFKGLLAEALTEKNNADIAEVSKKYFTILTEKDFNNLLKLLQQADLLAIDTETTDLNYMNAEIVGLSFAILSCF